MKIELYLIMKIKERESETSLKNKHLRNCQNNIIVESLNKNKENVLSMND